MLGSDSVEDQNSGEYAANMWDKVKSFQQKASGYKIGPSSGAWKKDPKILGSNGYL